MGMVILLDVVAVRPAHAWPQAAVQIDWTLRLCPYSATLKIPVSMHCSNEAQPLISEWNSFLIAAHQIF
jgi:hypothetical protein